jgi:diadenosine tetraphosphate (Ap4A) HIT family hydrolase
VRERVAVDDCWRVAHAVDTALPGWLVLVPRRHVVAIADLTDAEAASLGSWQVRLSRALHAVTGCTKTYVVQFAEAEGFQHVHFHVVPRMPDLAAERRGPGVFALLGVPEDHRVTVDRMDELAAALAEHLSQSPPSQPATGHSRRAWLPTDRTGGPLDTVLDEVRRRHPGVVVVRLQPSHQADDDNVFFLSDDQRAEYVQIDTGPHGNPPFIIEAGERRETSEPSDAADLISMWLQES